MYNYNSSWTSIKLTQEFKKFKKIKFIILKLSFFILFNLYYNKILILKVNNSFYLLYIEYYILFFFYSIIDN